jgi:tetratricopeptide (TPR) repeat protein
MAKKSLSVQRTLTRAASHAKKGEHQQAYQLYKAVLDKFPKNVQALRGVTGLGDLQKRPPKKVPSQAKIDEIMSLYEAKQYKHAMAKTKALVKAFPRFHGAYNLAGVILAEVGQWDNAIKAYKQALGLKPDFADALYNYAIALEHMKRTDEAIASLRSAVKADPAHAKAHNNLGSYLEIQGKMEDAISSYQRAIEIQPDFVNPHLRLGILINYKAGDPRIEELESFLENFEGDTKTKARLYFGLAKAYEDIGDIDTTFEYLLAGNGLRKAQKEYTTQMDKDLIEDIKSYFSSDTFLPTELAPQSFEPPIFIVGMPRSGTTLSEQILASHSSVFGAGEMPTISAIMKPELAEFAVSGNRTLDIELCDKIRKGCLDALNKLDIPENIIVDKMPLNFLWIGFIFAAFPNAKIINLNRDPVATGWSIFKYNFASSGNRYAHDLREIGEFYNLYIDIMTFWREKFPGKIYDLNYEALTEDQEGETRKLLEYCGLDWEAGCLDFHKSNRVVKTVSSSQVRKKMYKGSSQAWRKYEKHLGPLLDALGYKDA